MDILLIVAGLVAITAVNAAWWWLRARITAAALRVAEDLYEYWYAEAKGESARADDLRIANESLSARNEMLVGLVAPERRPY